MAAENYALIVICYAFGCFCAFRLGKNLGFNDGADALLNYIAKKRGKPREQVARDLQHGK